MLHLWDIASGREKLALADAHVDRVNSAIVTHDGDKLITASADRTIRVWSIETGRQLKVLNHEDRVSTIACSSDSRFLIAGMEFKPIVYIWDLAGDASPRFLRPSESILALAYSNHGRSIVIFGKNGDLQRWNSTDNRLMKNKVSLKSLLGPLPFYPSIQDVFVHAAFFAGGSKLAVTAIDSGLHIVDVESGKETGRLQNAALVVASPDERTLASTRAGPRNKFKRMGNEGPSLYSETTNTTVVLVDAETCRETMQIEVDGSEVWALAFSPDGKTLAATSGWETGQIHLYEVATGNEIRVIDTPATRTPALTFSPDGSKLICGMADTSVLVWALQPRP